MQPPKFIADHLVWLVTAMIWYRNVFFVGIPGMTVSQSKRILWLSVLVLVALGCIITIKRRRNALSVFVNIFLPYEMYAAVTYCTFLPGLVWSSVLLSVFLSIAFIVLGAFPVKSDRQRRAGWWKQQVRHSLLGARTIVAICMLILIVPIGIRLVFGLGLMNTSTPSVADASEAGEWTVKNKIDSVCLLREDDWEELSAQKKMDVLGVILNIEIRYLGINHEIYLKSGVLDDDTAARYNHREREIEIDIGQLQSASAADVLNSLCHECYHSYQYQMIALYESTSEEYQNMLLFQHVDNYINEFTNYIDGSEDPLGYYLQTTEIQARRYAELAVEDYYERIDDCLQEAD